jgi:transcription termination/antitermination protein NusA
MAITSANQLELLQTAEAVAREKMIDPDLVIQAMEDSLARAAKSRYGAEMDIRVKIDRKTGRASFTRVRTVVEDEAGGEPPRPDDRKAGQILARRPADR